jgi:hypothetical protein
MNNNDRLFLLSNEDKKEQRKRNNRKTKCFDECFNYMGEELIILQGNKNNQGSYVEILNKMIEQLDIALQIHKRLMILRVDFHSTYYTGNSRQFSKFINRLKQWIYRNYGIRNIGHVWAREQGRAKTQHYHLALFLDENKIRHPKRLIAQIQEMWAPYGHIPVIKNPYYSINKSNFKNQRHKAIKRISYLAKVKGKGYRNKQAKDFSTSRLKMVSKVGENRHV